MAKKEKVKKPKRPKGNGMFAQFRQQAQFLKEVDPKAMPVGILFASIAFVVLVVVGALVSGLNFLGMVIWVVLAIVTAYLTLLLTMTRRANTVECRSPLEPLPADVGRAATSR